MVDFFLKSCRQRAKPSGFTFQRMPTKILGLGLQSFLEEQVGGKGGG